MESDEETQNKRPQVRRTQGCQENFQAERKQFERITSQSRSVWDDSGRFNRSNWSGRDPFGFVGGEVVNRLIEYIRTDIEESQEIIFRHTQKLEKLVIQLQELKELQQLQNKAMEEAAQDKLTHKEE